MKLILLIYLILFSSTRVLASPSLAQLIELIKQEMYQSTQLVYRDSNLDLTGISGFIISNEFGAQQFRINTDEAGAMVGFGSTHNYSIAASRRARHLILADITEEVAIHHYGFWRILFMIAETPQEMLSYLSFNDLNPNGDIDDLFRQMDRTITLESILITTTSKLGALLKTGKITPVSALFFQKMLVAQIDDLVNSSHPLFGTLIRPSIPFNHTHQAEGLAYRLSALYSIDELNRYYQKSFGRTMSDLEIQELKKFRFLEPNNYRHLRELFLQNKVEYAVTDVHEAEFWRTLNIRLKKQDLQVSDLYLSNIPYYFADSFAQYRSDSIASLAAHYLGYNIEYTYEAEGLGGKPFVFKTQRLAGSPFELPFVQSCELVRSNTRFIKNINP